MKLKNKILVGALISLSVTAVSAKNSSFREQVASSSIGRGLDQSIQVLQRVPGPGRDARAAQVLDLVEASIPGIAGKAVKGTQQLDNSLMLHGEGFVVDVRGDGSWVRFERLDRGANGVSSADKMSEQELESLGRQFVSRELSDQVQIGGEETLELWGTSYEVELVGSDAGETERSVVASRVVFTRAIGGVPVVGPGSKVSVTFNTVGEPVGFAYDWSLLEATSESESPASLTKIHSRRAALAQQHLKGAKQQVQLERMECGYYDLGARVGAGVQLHAACVAQHRIVEGNQLKSMQLLDAVPAAAAIPDEAAWPEASNLRASGSK